MTCYLCRLIEQPQIVLIYNEDQTENDPEKDFAHNLDPDLFIGSDIFWYHVFKAISNKADRLSYFNG